MRTATGSNCRHSMAQYPGLPTLAGGATGQGPMKKKKITLGEIARLAGVGKATASRVFTEGASVAPATRERVLTVARDLGYQPSQLAKSLSTGRTHYVGVIFAYMDNPFYAASLEVLTYTLQDAGYQVLLLMAWNDTPEEEKIIQKLLDYRVEGIIAGSASISNAIAQRCADLGIPVVMYNRDQLRLNLPAVVSANYQGAHAATRLLIRTGHTRIAHIAGWQQATTGIERAKGFSDAMAEAGLKPVAITDARFLRHLAVEATHRLMRDGPRPDAILVGNDNMAMAVMDVLTGAYGLDIPGDVSVIGYDDAACAQLGRYDLTTVRQPVGQMAREAVGLIESLILDPAQPARKVVAPATLVVGSTVRGIDLTTAASTEALSRELGIDVEVRVPLAPGLSA